MTCQVHFLEKFKLWFPIMLRAQSSVYCDFLLIFIISVQRLKVGRPAWCHILSEKNVWTRSPYLPKFLKTKIIASSKPKRNKYFFAIWIDLYFGLHQTFFGTFEKSSEYIICNEVMRFGDVDFTWTNLKCNETTSGWSFTFLFSLLCRQRIFCLLA